MRRRWIVGGIALIALLATLSVLMLGRAPAPLPTVVWYCEKTGVVRDSPCGDRVGGFSATLTHFVRVSGSGTAPVFATHAAVLLRRSPTFAERAIGWLDPSRTPWVKADALRYLDATGNVETVDGLSWERFDFGLPPASPR